MMYITVDIHKHFCSCMSTLQCHGLFLGWSGSLVKLSGQRLKSTWYHFSELHKVILEVDRDFLEIIYYKSPTQIRGQPRSGYSGTCPVRFLI